ncbi:hypothetical protein [Streptomyces sp. NRRL S-340]|uniref:hypothetical protein n=1 Tax=Streptomyces sp. NRRL S-340 TaxID=1463901 RepID=UPI00056C55C9|nr:hypothetical protein [Streptomyces sp. NRRL S-340]
MHPGQGPPGPSGQQENQGQGPSAHGPCAQGPGPTGGAVLLVCAGAVALLGRAVTRMRGETV